MNKKITLAFTALSCVSLNAELHNFNKAFATAASAAPSIEKRIRPTDTDRRAPTEDLCELHNCTYHCSLNLLEQTKQDIKDSDATLAQYINNNEIILHKRFDEMATSYAQDVTSAINSNVTASALAYIAYHNELAQHDNVIAIFYADWFQPYQLMRPALEQLSEKYAGKIQFIEINTNTMHIFQTDIKHIPTLIFYKKSAAVDIHVGIGIDEDIAQEIVRFVSEANPQASPNELSELVRIHIIAEIEQILDEIIQEHFDN